VEREIRILEDGAAIAKRAAQEFVQAATLAVREKGSFNAVLAGRIDPKSALQPLGLTIPRCARKSLG